MSFEKKIINSDIKAKATRLSFGETLAALGEENPKIVALDADLSKSTRTDLFAAKFPDRFFQIGIAEANMIGVAAGLANAGWIPFAASFGCFLTGRYDQIRMSVAFSGSNVRLVGTHAGVAIGEDGHSQMALEDVTLMRSLPNMTVFQPADEKDTQRFVKWSLVHKGPCYMRLTRQNVPALNRPIESAEKFEAGKWEVLDGVLKPDSVVVIGTGGMVAPMLGAADILAEHGIQNINLVNANWLQPYDGEYLSKVSESGAKLVVTIEDHFKNGGLGGIVAEHLSGLDKQLPLLRIGVTGFGQSGSPADNLKAYMLDPKGIAKQILSRLHVNHKLGE